MLYGSRGSHVPGAGRAGRRRGLEMPLEEADATDTQAKWKWLGDTNFALAEAAAVASDDFSGMLLLYTATGNMAGMRRLSADAG